MECKRLHIELSQREGQRRPNSDLLEFELQVWRALESVEVEEIVEVIFVLDGESETLPLFRVLHLCDRSRQTEAEHLLQSHQVFQRSCVVILHLEYQENFFHR